MSRRFFHLIDDIWRVAISAADHLPTQSDRISLSPECRCGPSWAPIPSNNSDCSGFTKANFREWVKYRLWLATPKPRNFGKRPVTTSPRFRQRMPTSRKAFANPAATFATKTRSDWTNNGRNPNVCRSVGAARYSGYPVRCGTGFLGTTQLHAKPGTGTADFCKEQVSFLTLASAELEMLSRMTCRNQRIFANGDAIVFAHDRQLPFRRLPSI